MMSDVEQESLIAVLGEKLVMTSAHKVKNSILPYLSNSSGVHLDL